MKTCLRNLVLAGSALATAAGGAAALQSSEPPALLLGEFVDDYGIRYEISAREWRQLPDDRYVVHSWHPADRHLIARNESAGSEHAGLWMRIDWLSLDDGGDFPWAFCYTVYDAPTAAAAAQAPPARRDTPRTGCNGHPFSRMRSGAQVAGGGRQGPGGWREEVVAAEVRDLEVRAVAVDTRGDVWLGVRDRGLARLRGEEVVWIGAEAGLELAGVADIHEDRRGRMWVTGPGGFALRDGDAWTTRRTLGGLQPRVIFNVYEEEGGAVWLAGSGGAGRSDGDSWTVLRREDGLPHAVVHDVAVDRDGVAWLACRTGLARFTDGTVEVVEEGLNFRSALALPDGSVWFGTADGIRVRDGRRWTSHLRGHTVVPLLQTTDGSVWAGSSDGMLFRYNGAEWQEVPLPQRLHGAEVFDLAEERDGSVYVASAAGLAKLAPGGP